MNTSVLQVLLHLLMSGPGLGWEWTYVEAEVSFQHGAEVLSNITHAGVKSRHQPRVEGQEVQPEGADGLNSIYHSNSATWRLAERSTLTRMDRWKRSQQLSITGHMTLTSAWER